MQMVNLDQTQEGETIPKDVWGAVERKMSRGELFLRAKIVVCSVGEESRSNAVQFREAAVEDAAHAADDNFGPQKYLGTD